MVEFFYKRMSVFGFLIFWEIIGRSGIVHISLFPPPTLVFKAFFEMFLSGELIRDIFVSLWRAIVGWMVGSFFGIWVGILTGRNSTINQHITPIIQLFRPLPPVAIIPLIIVWLGIGEISKIFSISFAVFFPVWINTHQGAKEISPFYVWSAKSLGLKEDKILWKVILPGALDYIKVGLRIGIATAFIMVFVSELAGASAGVGYQISISQLAYRVDRMMAALVTLGLLGKYADDIFIILLNKYFPWMEYSNKK